MKSPNAKHIDTARGATNTNLRRGGRTMPRRASARKTRIGAWKIYVAYTLEDIDFPNLP